MGKLHKKSRKSTEGNVLYEPLKPFGIGLIGFGTIGTGVVRTLTENRDVISKNLGLSLKLVKIVDMNLRWN